MKQQVSADKLQELASLIESLRQDQTDASDETKQQEPEIFGANIGEILTEQELSKLLNLGMSTLWKMRRDGEIGYCRVGRNAMYLKKHVLEYLAKYEY